MMSLWVVGVLLVHTGFCSVTQSLRNLYLECVLFVCFVFDGLYIVLSAFVFHVCVCV